MAQQKDDHQSVCEFCHLECEPQLVHLPNHYCFSKKDQSVSENRGLLELQLTLCLEIHRLTVFASIAGTLQNPNLKANTAVGSHNLPPLQSDWRGPEFDSNRLGIEMTWPDQR
ncbi:MAG: hypothetical protein A2X74_10810 [Polynucleobacter sp. GWA2_45_21]|nr:MAG: hypothetical protein A2X74_10810 [Polynucleobacter sp. GWA2_45_21]